MTQAQNLADLSQLYTGYPLAFRNRIINGDARVSMRPVGTASANSRAFSPDRWFTNLGVGTPGAIQINQATLGYKGISKSAIALTVNTAVTDVTAAKFVLGMEQTVEGVNCFDMLGVPMMLSFLVYATVAGLYSVNLRDSGGTYSYCTSINLPATTVVPIVLPIPACPLAASLPNSNAAGWHLDIGSVNSGQYVHSAPGTWLAGNFICPAGMVNWAATSGANLIVTDVQLEIGPYATQFERRPYGLELFLCQRYFESIVLSGAQGFFLNATQAYVPVPFQTKRANPVLSLGSGGTWQCSNGTGNYPVTNITIGGIGVNTSFLIATVTGNPATNAPAMLNSTNGYGIYLEAEL